MIRRHFSSKLRSLAFFYVTSCALSQLFSQTNFINLVKQYIQIKSVKIIIQNIFDFTVAAHQKLCLNLPNRCMSFVCLAQKVNINCTNAEPCLFMRFSVLLIHCFVLLMRCSVLHVRSYALFMRCSVPLMRCSVLPVRSSVLLVRNSVLLMRSSVLLMCCSVLLMRCSVLLMRSYVLLVRCSVQCSVNNVLVSFAF